MNKAELIEKLSDQAKLYHDRIKEPNHNTYKCGFDTGQNLGFAHAYQEARMLAEKLTEPQWISVSDGLPDKVYEDRFSDYVLVTIENRGKRVVIEDRYDFICSLWLNANDTPTAKVIGWMPKPEPMK